MTPTNAERLTRAIWLADVRGDWDGLPSARRDVMIAAAQAELERIVEAKARILLDCYPLIVD